MIEASKVNARKSQDIGVDFTSKISPNIKNIRENKMAISIPQIEPQSRESCPLFFFAEINPPKNDEVYIEKNENGVSRECGLSLNCPINENSIRSATRIAIEENAPNAEDVSIPLLYERFFSLVLFFIKYSLM